MKKINLAITGCMGRMGQQIIKSVKSKYFINGISKVKFIKTKYNYFKDYNPKKIMGIFLTSGTTGGPKGVCHSSENLVGNAIAFNLSLIHI